ncbi:MAG: GNAT family acetyltransferase [Pseudohongiella sp.]|nr:GNAT family acetyltransferase [Pseudohongiella sp.]
MNIRAFSKTDQSSVIALWNACGLTRPWNNPAKDIDRKLAVQPELFLVGELDGHIVASAMAGYDGHRGSVYYLAVSPEHQGNGFGQLLMASIERLLTEKGCPKMNILVRSSNARVLGFYDKLGYKPDETVCIGKRLIADHA